MTCERREFPYFLGWSGGFEQHSNMMQVGVLEGIPSNPAYVWGFKKTDRNGWSLNARWWQLKYLLFSPRSLGKWSNLTSIFFRWVVQPPTSNTISHVWMANHIWNRDAYDPIPAGDGILATWGAPCQPNSLQPCNGDESIWLNRWGRNFRMLKVGWVLLFSKLCAENSRF